MTKGTNLETGRELSEFGNSALSLRCENEEDLEVISGLFQDALISNIDFHFSKREKNFLFVANRFCWERVPTELGEKVFYRVLSGVNIQNVISVKHKGFIKGNDDQPALFYNLLTIDYDNKKKEITLVFSQNVCVNLNVSKLDIFIKDIEEPYPTQKIPNHFN